MASTSSSSTRHRAPGPSGSLPRQLSHTSSSRTPPTSLPLPSDPMAPSSTTNSGNKIAEARFHRAVDMVQSFPKSGPVNTTYEEKLMLYSLYKQATEGPVTTTRPKLLDFLGRAKWDAWKARQGLTKQQAQESYVDTLMNILKSFSERPQAREMLEELRAFPASSGIRAGATGQSGHEQDYASTTSSHRSLSPPPETATSRRSYHSALHTTSSIPEGAYPSSFLEDDLTPRRPIRQRQGHVDPNESRRVNVPMSSEEDEEDEEDYSDIEEPRERAEASGSQTVSDVSDNETPMREVEQRIPRTRPAGPVHPHHTSSARQQHRSHGSDDYTLPPSSSSAALPARGPSPYQHPAQYPAPVQTQLPPHLPPVAPDSASRTGSFRQPGQAQLLRARQQQQTTQQAISQSTPELSAVNRNIQSATVDRALDSIQTSLAALHERLNLMEQTQAALQASNDPRRGSGLRAYISRSPILQFLRLFFVRMLELFRIRSRSATADYRRNGLSSLLGRALLSVLLGIRDLSRDAIAIIFLVASITSLRNTRGDWRAVVRAWARILALATGVGVVREGGWLLGNGVQQV